MAIASNWLTWALFSAVFAALTAIFAKIGLAGVDSDLATLIRTVIIFGVLGAFVYATGKWSNPFELSGKTWLFLVLSGLATAEMCMADLGWKVQLGSGVAAAQEFYRGTAGAMALAAE